MTPIHTPIQSIPSTIETPEQAQRQQQHQQQQSTMLSALPGAARSSSSCPRRLLLAGRRRLRTLAHAPAAAEASCLGFDRGNNGDRAGRRRRRRQGQGVDDQAVAAAAAGARRGLGSSGAGRAAPRLYTMGEVCVCGYLSIWPQTHRSLTRSIDQNPTTFFKPIQPKHRDTTVPWARGILMRGAG